ncbi:MAG: ferritin-like domain-containing protein [Candidatus Omnitrophica bacterium]|nr:ferritin-like domain-containing protein [Candidatus Omnitrophota bacterium]
MSKELKTLKDLYVHELKDIYSAEKQITKALPKLAKAANSEELKSAFERHLKQTEGQINRLEQVLKRLGESTAGPKCKGMEGLLAEGEEFCKEEASDSVLDAGLVVAAQKVEHYEIAAYGSVCTFAKLLGFDKDLQILRETLSEEVETDEKLTQLSQEINPNAESGLEEEEEEMGTMAKSHR